MKQYVFVIVGCIFLTGLLFVLSQTLQTLQDFIQQPSHSSVAGAKSSVLQASVINCTVDSQQAGIDPEEQRMLGLINAYRQQNGLQPLQFSGILTNAAQWMANDMSVNGIWSHTDSLGRDPKTRMMNCGYPNVPMAENLSRGSGNADEVFDGWKRSPAHNANMLNASYVVIGLARVYNLNSPVKWHWAFPLGGKDDGSRPITVNVTPVPTEPLPTSWVTIIPSTVISSTPVPAETCDSCLTKGEQYLCTEGLYTYCASPIGNIGVPTSCVPCVSVSPSITQKPSSSPTLTQIPSVTTTVTSPPILTPTITGSTTPTSSQSPSLSPATPSPTPSTPRIVVAVKIPGIGVKVGDTPFPIITQKALLVTLFDINNMLVAEGLGIAKYSNGEYKGTIYLNKNLPKGVYWAKIQANNTLSEFVNEKNQFLLDPAIVTALPTTLVISGDINEDNILNILDYNIILSCYGSNQCSYKNLADLNSDGKVDEIDINIFLRNLSTQQYGD